MASEKEPKTEVKPKKPKPPKVKESAAPAEEKGALETTAVAKGPTVGAIAAKTEIAHPQTPSKKIGKLPKKNKKRLPRKLKKSTRKAHAKPGS
jgi:hypothetical protein